ncbi:tetratricopeptide repeat-containing sulfotransferase family protein [Sphingomonas jaspsi]|uniref:tetratricopeptide repeat-containing sulfotransferase family protein n=1 Tax=Sphingomonas jaspsi TaxID=392409 RepID=UPI0005695352|nr:tetratricopeptide repeat-containing sulfotransferase family protein [Sphingomonas jaspsi]
MSETTTISNVPTGANGRNGTVDEAIAKAQQGRVSVSPSKAIEMATKLFSVGNFAQAEKVCRQVLSARPNNADAHNILAVALNAQGNSQEAIASLRRAIKFAPQAPNVHANLGEIHRRRGQKREAVQAFKDALKLDPGNAQAHNNLGIIAYEEGRFKDAADHYRKALQQRPNMAEALNNLGNALRMTGEMEGAMSAYQDALTHREIYPEAYNNLGTLLQADRQFDEAEHALRKAIQQSPQYVEAHNNLATLYASQQRDTDALRILGDALKFAPTNAATLLLTSKIQLRRANLPAAEQAARLALKTEPSNAEALTVLGQILHETDRYEEAISVLEKALEHAPDSPEARNFYGVALKSVGRLDEARQEILKALAKNDHIYGAYANLNDLVDFAKEDELFGKMDTIFAKAKNREAPALLPLHFAYGKALDDRGEHERALEHYITGGKMKRATLKYDEAETNAFFDGIRECFPKEMFEDRPIAGFSDERPVFIIGMPRSGSTLVEQIISAHPDIYGAGEVKYLSMSLGKLRDRFPSLPRYPQMVKKMGPAQFEIFGKSYVSMLQQGAGDSKRITDKLLTNYFFAGLINLVFPKARFIHTLRNPVDTCLSGFTKLFKDDMPHSYELGELGRYYGKYRELMAHWEQVLPAGVLHTVRYEEVVADTEKEARALIDFLGLEWNDACLEFHKSKRPVKTASVAQVRRPIYTSAVERWKKYGPGLQPLVDAIVATVPEEAERLKDTAPAKPAKKPSAKTATAKAPAKPNGPAKAAAKAKE